MSVLERIPRDLGSLTDAALVNFLTSAEAEERHVSRSRRRLHERIDNMQLRSDDSPEVAAELRTVLDTQERALSARRLQLHEQIIDLRVERSRRADQVPRNLRAVK